jgi:hemicentin
MGLCKEIVIDRTLAGQSLEDNIVVIAACNPARKQSSTGANTRERDLGREWAGGHYQVAELPHSIAKIKWSFGSLNHDQEKEFILRRLKIAGGETVPQYLQIALTEFISESQQAMRTFAARNIRDSLVLEHGEIGENIDNLASTRARSVVSLRDIQRVFAFFDFFSTSLQIPCILGAPGDEGQRRSMLLAIATVYYLRLDSRSRAEFLEMTRALPAEQGASYDLQWILNQAMDEVINDTDVPQGIAITRGLKENVFMTFVCTLSGTPLIIVGPPGSSKVSHSCVTLFFEMVRYLTGCFRTRRFL